MTILYIAIGVCAVAIAVYFIRLGIDKRKLEDAAIHRSIEDEECRERMKDPWPPLKSFDDTTVTLPTLPERKA